MADSWFLADRRSPSQCPGTGAVFHLWGALADADHVRDPSAPLIGPCAAAFARAAGTQTTRQFTTECASPLNVDRLIDGLRATPTSPAWSGYSRRSCAAICFGAQPIFKLGLNQLAEQSSLVSLARLLTRCRVVGAALSQAWDGSPKAAIVASLPVPQSAPRSVLLPHVAAQLTA